MPALADGGDAHGFRDSNNTCPLVSFQTSAVTITLRQKIDRRHEQILHDQASR